MTTKDNTFCPIPWIHLATRTNGDIRGCCNMNQGNDYGVYRKNDGKPFNLNVDSFEEALNSEKAIDVRQHMLEGKRHPECKRCWSEEDSGVKSRRVSENERWNGIFNYDDAYNMTNNDGSLDELKLMHFDLRFGNFCNLKCRMCAPTESSKWYEDWYKLHGFTGFMDSHGRVNLIQDEKGKWKPENNIYDWHNNQNFWIELEKCIPYMKNLYIVGGEPTLIEEMYDFLQKVVDYGYAHNITIEYNTNMTNIQPRALKLWKHFNMVIFGSSIDGYGIVNNYIRHPSKWETIEKNLYKIHDLTVNHNYNFKAWFAVTVQLMNILYIPDLIEWKLKNGLYTINKPYSPKPFINPHLLHRPHHYNVKVLPPETKEKVNERYNNLYKWFDEWIDNEATPSHFGLSEKKFYEKKDELKHKMRTSLNGFIDYMNKEEWADELLPKFWDETKRLDEIRDEKFEDVFPELYYDINRFLNKKS